MAFGTKLSRPLLGALVSMCAVGVVVACSASPDGNSGITGGNGGSSANGGTGGDNGGSAGSGNTGNTSFGGSGGIIDGGSNGGTGGFDPDADTCAGEVTQGERKPLDMYVMFDMSGSMDVEAAPGVSKWDAVRPALQGFLTAPESAGIGVGIQYFPLLAAGSSWTCTSNSQCSGGVCALKACSNLFPDLYLCANNGDCGFGGSCINLGNCGTDTNSICAPVGSTTACGGGVTCNQMTSSFCTNSDSCLVGEYQTPDVAIAELPGNAAAITASLNAQMPRGSTPTGPALQGAIQHAQSWASSHAGHQVVVVLVTDGTPTSCNPTDIGSIGGLASAALNGNPSVQTFVIGVFENGDTTGQSNANAIANAGGTGTAFVVDAASSSLGTQFAQALNDIRGTALSCEYSIPTPTMGTLDYDKVNVEFKDGSNTVTVPYVGDAGSCDPQLGGWYYDVDPATGGTPTNIVVCPTTCDQFTGASGAASVDVRLGCKREDIPR